MDIIVHRGVNQIVECNIHSLNTYIKFYVLLVVLSSLYSTNNKL